MAPRNPLQILDAARIAALRYADKSSRTTLMKLLRDAQDELNKRLATVERGTYTFAQIGSALMQIREVLRTVEQGLKKEVVNNAKVVGKNSTTATINYIESAERKFTGVSTFGLGLNTAVIYDRAAVGVESSVLNRLGSDPQDPRSNGILRRYDDSVIQQFEKKLALRMITGGNWDDVRNELVQESPFLQDSPRFWAERIIRTETMAAHNRAGFEAMNEINDEVDGEMVRILCATFDNRTAADSYAVHGQIRRMNEPFQSWFGFYMTPPNRPNDREIIVPHYLEWGIPPELKPRSNGEVAARWNQQGRKGSPPPRPLMSTIVKSAPSVKVR